MPNLHLWRPADGNETSAAYFVALQAWKTPSVLCLSRQNLPQLPNSSLAAASKGGYVIREVPNGSITLAATGSEVSIALETASVLAQDGVAARVVSLPCWEIFGQQSPEYQLSVFRPGQAVLSVEAYSSFGECRVSPPTCCVAHNGPGWSKFSHEHVGIDGWGDSAPPGVLYKHVSSREHTEMTPERESPTDAYLAVWPDTRSTCGF